VISLGCSLDSSFFSHSLLNVFHREVSLDR
jgi:hypothetical protein